MALISCPECAKQMSDKASTCPHCGYSVHCGSLDKGIIALIAGAVVMAGLFFLFRSTNVNSRNGFITWNPGPKIRIAPRLFSPGLFR
ncbi:MAG: hypothetical protein JW768_10195 [Chitinispirillaceae bacterium]|nr:hypothetical protein [Chitinispirillaceae bacterium]